MDGQKKVNPQPHVVPGKTPAVWCGQWQWLMSHNKEALWWATRVNFPPDGVIMWSPHPRVLGQPLALGPWPNLQSSHIPYSPWASTEVSWQTAVCAHASAFKAACLHELFPVLENTKTNQFSKTDTFCDGWITLPYLPSIDVKGVFVWGARGLRDLGYYKNARLSTNLRK